MRPKINDQELLDAWSAGKNAQQIADAFGMTVRQVYSRRRQLELETGQSIPVKNTRKFGVPFEWPGCCVGVNVNNSARR
jgi:hypothetical protein